MKLIVNDAEMELAEPATVAGLLATLGLPGTGIAVAVDQAVRPRSRWDEPLTAGARIEVLTAVQGG